MSQTIFPSSEKNFFPLLETLARRMGCEYLSDLKYLDTTSRGVLAGLVSRTPAGQVPREEWNDALTYLTGQDPQPDAETARRALLQALETFP